MTATAALGPTVRQAYAAGGAEAVLALARAARGPVVEPTGDPGTYAVTFVLADRRTTVRRAGLFCPAVEGGYAELADLGGVFAVTVPLPTGTRVKYHFCPDPPADPGPDELFRLAHQPAARRLDRLNPDYDQVELRGLRLRMIDSLLTLPGARSAPPATARPGVPAGTVETLPLDSAALGRRKEVVVQLPAGYRPDRGPYPLVLLLQGGDEWAAPAFLDNLLATGAVRPFVAVRFAERGSTARLRELNGDPPLTRFAVDELLPALGRRWAVDTDAVVVAGYSAGGLAAAALGVDEPGRFGRLAIVSGALHLGRTMDVRQTGGGSRRMLDRYAAAAARPARCYLAAGAYEDSWVPEIAARTRDLAALLEASGADVRLDGGPTGHDTRSARAYLATGLGWLLPAS